MIYNNSFNTDNTWYWYHDHPKVIGEVYFQYLCSMMGSLWKLDQIALINLRWYILLPIRYILLYYMNSISCSIYYLLFLKSWKHANSVLYYYTTMNQLHCVLYYIIRRHPPIATPCCMNLFCCIFSLLLVRNN